MGLFSRKEAASSRRQAMRPRPSVSSEAQAAALRVRARRRLAGAVALVLAAVIVLPMLLDGEPRPVPAGIEISIPSKETPMVSPSAPVQSSPELAAANPAEVVTSAAVAKAPLAEAAVAAIQPKPAAEKPKSPEAKPEASTAKPPGDSRARSDDGSRALALLEGRAPSSSPTPAASPGKFVVQLASYGVEGDANERRDKLKTQGITNAYIEPVTVNGKPMYRLRVGPFTSRDAAQAAQTRLRTLGYSSGFIASQ